MEAVRVLDAKVHSRLIADIDRIAAVARIPKTYIERSSKPVLSEDTIAWCVHLRKHVPHDVYGLVMSGGADCAQRKCYAVAGMLLRNFIDARVYSIDELILCEWDDVPDPTVMVIHNITHNELAHWQQQRVQSILSSRMGRGKLTVVCAGSLDLLERACGPVVHTFVLNNYRCEESI